MRDHRACAILRRDPAMIAARTLATSTRYEIFDEIGAGGVARVHLGRALGPAGFRRLVARVGGPDGFQKMIPLEPVGAGGRDERGQRGGVAGVPAADQRRERRVGGDRDRRARAAVGDGGDGGAEVDPLPHAHDGHPVLADGTRDDDVIARARLLGAEIGRAHV